MWQINVPGLSYFKFQGSFFVGFYLVGFQETNLGVLGVQLYVELSWFLCVFLFFPLFMVTYYCVLSCKSLNFDIICCIFSLKSRLKWNSCRRMIRQFEKLKNNTKSFSNISICFFTPRFSIWLFYYIGRFLIYFIFIIDQSIWSNT